MSEPINPQDHSLGDPTDPNSGVPMLPWTDSYQDWRVAALAEAIHQTFERDAWLMSAIADHDKAREEWQTLTLVEKEAHNFPNFPEAIPDPDTEIDREARLIVDAEYRRRKEAQSND